jgi:hypothetical protein
VAFNGLIAFTSDTNGDGAQLYVIDATAARRPS